jgi:hypothetical protein
MIRAEEQEYKEIKDESMEDNCLEISLSIPLKLK